MVYAISWFSLNYIRSSNKITRINMNFVWFFQFIKVGLQFKYQSMRQSLTFPIKMIDFVSDLYKNYKVLNKLSEKQSLEFQREVVAALVDSKQNVDRQIFQKIVQDQNIEAIILQLLAKVINRNPFKNQFELNRNLATITQNLKKEQQELQKKQKILERKEEKIKATEEGLTNIIKQKIQSFENESIQKIIKKQAEIKKSITQLFNQLKAKEKLILERYQQSKANAKLLEKIDQKEKMINQKLKNIEKKEKELKGKENQNEGMKKEAQLQLYKQQVQKLRESQKQAIKRYKNLQMAYKKLKTEKSKPESSQKIESMPKLQIKSNKIMDLDELQLSGIQQGQKNNDCEQFISYMNLQQANGKLQSLKKLLAASQTKNQALQLKQIRQVLKIQSKNNQQILHISHSQQSEEQDESREFMPNCLQPIAQATNMQDVIQKIKNINLQQDKDKLNFIRQQNLQKIIDDCYKMNTPHQLCEAILQKILELIEQSEYYMKIIQYLASEKVVSFLQHIYLSHQTNTDIIETTTLVLSRIKLKDFQLKFTNQFVKALQIRLKVESKGSFLYGNIQFILN